MLNNLHRVLFLQIKVLCAFVLESTIQEKSVYTGLFYTYGHINLDHQYKSTICVMVLRLQPSIVWVKFQLAYNPLNMNPILVGDGVVSMGDIEAAIQEVFQAPHIQVS